MHGTASREPAAWQDVPRVACAPLQEVLYAKAEGVAKVTINRPHKHNAFTPLTGAALAAGRMPLQQCARPQALRADSKALP